MVNYLISGVIIICMVLVLTYLKRRDSREKREN